MCWPIINHKVYGKMLESPISSLLSCKLPRSELYWSPHDIDDITYIWSWLAVCTWLNIDIRKPQRKLHPPVGAAYSFIQNVLFTAYA